MEALALCLSSSYTPLRFEPAPKALINVLKGRCEIVHEGEGFIGTGEALLPVPLTVRFLSRASACWQRKVKFSRNNIWLRDKGQCSYCRKRVSRKSMTLDHVIPRAQGGKTKWENIVTCCAPCNGLKEARTPEQAGMFLRVPPVRPKSLPGAVPFDMGWKDTYPACWKDFLGSVAYWTVGLDEDG